MSSDEVMKPSAAPIVEREGRPSMTQRGNLMPPVDEISDSQGGPRMEPRHIDQDASAGEDADEMDPIDIDVVPTATEPPPMDRVPEDDTGEGYLRLIVRFEHGELTVLRAQVVDGPMVEAEAIGDLAYQIVSSGRRLASGGLPDFFTERGFPAEQSDQAHHSIRSVDSGDFTVRVRREDVTQIELPQLEIELFRPTAPSIAPTPGETLQAEASRTSQPQPDVLARAVGIDISSLPADDANLLRRRLR